MDKRTSTDDEQLDDAVMHADDTGMLREQHEIIEEELLHGEGALEIPDDEQEQET
ncbi:MAG TPA: hypothetical protein VFE17_05485 [Candidatus Baltobacteraceae bacterium]|jgi:hypothetical protein|nr:hypothetical protein [Candidatus Baltobacteraceae bacterium]